MADVVSSLVVDIAADIGGLQRGLDQADRSISGFARGVGSSLSGLGAQMTAITAPLALGLGTGIKVASDFENVMAEIEARAGLTAGELENMSNFALQMGADTAFSGQQAAEALLQLLTSGQNAEQAMATLPAVLDAAAASGEDLGKTADTLTDIMAAFGLQVGVLEDGFDATTYVTNALAQAAGASSASMGDLGEGFANVGPVAKQYGLTVSRTAAILAVLSENGIKGAEAGTALKSMLLNMTRPTEAVYEAWADLGTSFYDTEGNARNMVDILADIKLGLEDMTVEEQNEVLQQLAGSYGIVGLQALLGSTSIEDMEAAMSASAGAGDVAAARMDTFAGRLDSLKGSVETLMITALTPFMNDVLKPLAEQATVVVNKITEWAAANPALASQVVGIAAAAVVLGPALIAAGIGIQAIGVALGAMGAAIALVTSPLFLAAAGAVALGAAIAYLWTQDIGGIRTRIEELGNALSEIDFSGIARSIETDLSEALYGAYIDASGVTTAIQTALSEAITSLSGISIDTSGVTAWATDNMNAILGAVVAVAGIVFGGPVGLAIGAARLIATAIENDFLGIGTFLNTSGITAAVETALNTVKTTIDGLIQSIFSGGASNATANDDAIMAGVFPSGGGLSGPLQTFVDDLRMGVDWLSGELPKIIEPIKTGLSDLGTGIQGFIENLSGVETDGILRVVTAIAGAIGIIATKVAEFGAEALGAALSAIGSTLPSIGSAINDFVSALSDLGQGDIGSFLTNIADGLGNIGEAILQFVGLDIQIPDIATALAGWQTAIQGLPVVIGEIANQIGIGFRGILDGIVRGIDLFILDVQIKITEFVGTFRDKILELTGGQVDIAPDINISTADLRFQMSDMQIADALAAELNAQLASSGPINLSAPLELDTAQGSYSAPLFMALNSPNVVAEMSEAGKEAARAAVNQAVQEAVATGDADAFQSLLLPLATTLDMDTADMQTQMDAAVALAAAGISPNVTVGVDITVTPRSIDTFSVTTAVQGAVAAAQTGASSTQLPSYVPQFATGGMMTNDGLAYLHAGERVLNPVETAAYNSGQSGGGNVININGVQNVDGMLAELKRRGIVLTGAA